MIGLRGVWGVLKLAAFAVVAVVIPKTLRRTRRRAFLAASLSLVMGLGVAITPGVAPASASGDPACGPQDEDGKHLVSTLEHLQNVGTGDGVCGPGASYIQTADIDLICVNWNPIGSSSAPFSGTYNGNRLIILNLSINKLGEDRLGLFAQTSASATLEKIRLENVDVRGRERVGGLVGLAVGDVKNMSVTGTATAERGLVGGLVGQGNGSVKLENYLAFVGTVRGSIVSNNSGSGPGVGGIGGRTSSSSTVSQAYVRGEVTANRAGGIVGDTSGNPSTVTESYASVKIGVTTPCASRQGAGGLQGHRARDRTTIVSWPLIYSWSDGSQVTIPGTSATINTVTTKTMMKGRDSLMASKMVTFPIPAAT